MDRTSTLRRPLTGTWACSQKPSAASDRTTGVQDVGFDTAATVQAVVDLKAGKTVPETLLDPGFVIHQGNLAQVAPRMWGAGLRK